MNEYKKKEESGEWEGNKGLLPIILIIFYNSDIILFIYLFISLITPPHCPDAALSWCLARPRSRVRLATYQRRNEYTWSQPNLTYWLSFFRNIFYNTKTLYPT